VGGFPLVQYRWLAGDDSHSGMLCAALVLYGVRRVGLRREKTAQKREG
jgi:hypothetical protein